MEAIFSHSTFQAKEILDINAFLSSRTVSKDTLFVLGINVLPNNNNYNVFSTNIEKTTIIFKCSRAQYLL